MITQQVKDRYLQDALPVRLGGLAADLARVSSFAENPANRSAVVGLLNEGKHFAEWTAPDAPLETQELLADVQLELAIWELALSRGKPVPTMRTHADQRAAELLKLAGLVE